MYASPQQRHNSDLDPVPPFGNASANNTIASKSLETKFLDSLSFSQLTPPPIQRKFATVQPPSPMRHTSEARLVLSRPTQPHEPRPDGSESRYGVARSSRNPPIPPCSSTESNAHSREASAVAFESRLGLSRPVQSQHMSTSTAASQPFKPASPPVVPVAPRQATGRLCSPVYSKPQRSPQAVFRAAPVYIARSGQNSASSNESSPETLRPTRSRMLKPTVGNVTPMGERSPMATHHAQPAMVSSPYTSHRQSSMASIVGRQRKEKGWFESEGL
ncbi:hypothetical protein AAVH_05796 [Aphelenchoides avenae]|nr:hypothetical protein AAVH_05796 [Aphelenchus avenae]